MSVYLLFCKSNSTIIDIGLLPERNFKVFKEKESAIIKEINRLNSTHCGTFSLAKILSRPENKYKDIPGSDQSLSDEVIQQVEIAVKYAGYISRQELEVEKGRNLEGKEIPLAFDYATVPSLRHEARQKLAKIRPATIGQAARISGVSPADISILLVWLKRFGSKDSNLSPCDAKNTNNEDDNACG